MPGHPSRWVWNRPLFGPRLTAEEATAWMHLLGRHDDISSPFTIALEMARYVPGAFGFGEACGASGGDRLPAAARLTALVAIEHLLDGVDGTNAGEEPVWV